jgi:L-threonylcarbamoyladenylate synthase
MQLLRDQFDNIVQDLREGKVLLMPTDTIWGLVCDAMQPPSIQRIYDIKEVKEQKGLVLLVSDLDMLRQYAASIHPRIETLLSFHIRPLTVIYHTKANPDLPDSLFGPDASIAIRITLDPLCQSVIKALGRPIVAAAACSQDEPAPAHFGEIKSNILTKVDYIMKYRQDDKRTFLPSVIARMGSEEELDFVRE